MGEVMPPSDVAALELAQFQHQCDQMMFWVNYKVTFTDPFLKLSRQQMLLFHRKSLFGQKS